MDTPTAIVLFLVLGYVCSVNFRSSLAGKHWEVPSQAMERFKRVTTSLRQLLNAFLPLNWRIVHVA